MRVILPLLRYLTLILLWLPAGAQPVGARYVSATPSAGSFPLVAAGHAAALYASETDWQGVLRAIRDVQADIGRVSGQEPVFTTDAPRGAQPVVLIGTLGHSPLVDKLVQRGKLDVTNLAGRWETFVVQALDNPLPGVGRALVVVGSDRRGTIYGLYDLAQQLGVSPWHWWADVPVVPQPTAYVAAGRHTLGEPAIKYRGLALSDAAPAFVAWAQGQFGPHRQAAHEQVLELILRLKGNYLVSSQADGDAPPGAAAALAALADTYGVVLGTSLGATPGGWGAGPSATAASAGSSPATAAQQPGWPQRLRRLGSQERLLALGVGQDSARPLPSALLAQTLAAQRRLLAAETHRPAAHTPQLWALGPAEQACYDQGLRVPPNVTLLLGDDSWGHLRRLPSLGEPARRGGYGIQYHLGPASGPQGYQYLHTSPLPRLWEQLHLAHAYGADRVWLASVGTLKPLELPISFFFDYAWCPAALPIEAVGAYTQRWAAQQFGPAHAGAIASVLAQYAKYNARCPPERLDAATYSVVHFREAETVVAEYNALLARAETLSQQLPASCRVAYCELVLNPVQASATRHALYYTVALNREAARRNQANTNALAAQARALSGQAAARAGQYDTLAGGKWRYLFGPAGSSDGAGPLAAAARPIPAVLTLPPGAPTMPALPRVAAHAAATAGLVDSSGYVAIEAEHYSRAVGAGPITWQHLPDLGRTLGAMTTFPVTAAPTAAPGSGSPHLEYRVVLAQPGPVTVSAYLAPALAFGVAQGLRYAVSLDEEAPQLVRLPTEADAARWAQAVLTNSVLETSRHLAPTAGPHVLKFWRIDPGVVLEKLVVSQGALPASYLGPPEKPAAP